MKTQKNKLYGHLLKGFKLSHLGAWRQYKTLGSFSKIISLIRAELKDKGITLLDEWHTTKQGKRFKMFWIAKKDLARLGK
jgi:hypothetical protein